MKMAHHFIVTKFSFFCLMPLGKNYIVQIYKIKLHSQNMYSRTLFDVLIGFRDNSDQFRSLNFENR